LVFIGIGLACVLLALLVGYVIRVALTVILIAGAPLALMCHALPQTEGIARWWWRAFAGVLAIQLVQSLTLVAALNVFLGPGGFSFFGPTRTGLVNLIVTFALFYILFKIPFWILNAVQVGNGRSFVGGVVKGLIAYKTLGALGLRGPSRSVATQHQAAGASGRGWGGTAGTARPGRRPPGPSGGGGPQRRPRPQPDRGGGGGSAGTARPTAGAQSRQRQPLASRAPTVRTATRPARGAHRQPGAAASSGPIAGREPVCAPQRRRSGTNTNTSSAQDRPTPCTA